MGPIDNHKTSSTSDTLDAAPEPAGFTVPEESSDSDIDHPPEISPKSEVTPRVLIGSAGPLPEEFCKGENDDPISDPFLETISKGKSRTHLVQSSTANHYWRTPSQPPPIEPLLSSKEDDEPGKESSLITRSQRRTSLGSSPQLKPSTNHTRATSAPFEPIEKPTFDLPPFELRDDVGKALEEFGLSRRRFDPDLTAETPDHQKPQGSDLWLFGKDESRGEDITTNQKHDILADVLSLNSDSSPNQPAGIDGGPAILVEQASDGEDPSKVQSAPRTPPLQSGQPNVEKALHSASSRGTPLGPETISQKNTTRKILPIKKKRIDSSVSSPVTVTPLNTSPGPFSNYISASYAQWQQSSSKDSDTVKSQNGIEIQTPHQKSSQYASSTSDSGKKTENRDKAQLQHSDSSEAEAMLNRLLGLKYFQGAQSSLNQLSLILRLLQQRDSRTSTQALGAPQKETNHVQPCRLASVTDTEKPRFVERNESVAAGSDIIADKPVDKEPGRRSSNPQEPGKPSLLPISSSSWTRSASESAISTNGNIFLDVPGVTIPADLLSIREQIDIFVRFTPSKENKSKELISFITTEENIALKKLTPWELPQRYEGTKLPEHLKQEIQRPIKRDVKVGTPHHGRIYLYWNEGNFGLVKIGFTTQTEETRLKKWRSECKRRPHPIKLYRVYQDGLPHIRRVEHLIHTELRDQRVTESACAGCQRNHVEWFVVTNERAKQVTQKWCDWMQQHPYEKVDEKFSQSCDGKERVKEEWTLKQEHVDSLKEGELLFKNGESSRRASLLGPAPVPATAPPKLQSRLSQPAASSPRSKLPRSSSAAGRLSNSSPDEQMGGSFRGRTAAAAAAASILLSPDTPTPPEGRRRSASQLN